MRRGIRILLAVGLLIPAILLSGCLFNIFQTAKTIGAGHLGLTLGSGLIIPGAQVVTPQARLTFGVSDRVDFGLQTGGAFGLDGASATWMGAAADMKVSLFNGPKSLALALGVGAEYVTNWIIIPDVQPDPGYWTAFVSVYLDSNVPFLPLYASYRPLLVLRVPDPGDTIQILNQFAIGIALPISDAFRLVLEYDIVLELLNSFGVGFEIVF